MLIGITGSIGAGKSTAIEILRELGFETLDADKIVHELYASGNLTPELKKYFPEAFKYGYLDKKNLAEIVFSDKNKLKTLEAIIHPMVRKEIEKRYGKYRKIPDRHAFVEVQLLIEAGWQDMFDYILIVDAPLETRLKRAIKRGMAPEDFLKRNSLQKPIEEKIRYCKNFKVLENTGSKEELRRELLQTLKALGIVPSIKSTANGLI